MKPLKLFLVIFPQAQHFVSGQLADLPGHQQPTTDLICCLSHIFVYVINMFPHSWPNHDALMIILIHKFENDKNWPEFIDFCFRPSQRTRLSGLHEEGGTRHLSSRDAHLAARLRGPEEAGIPSRLGSRLGQRKLRGFPVLQSRRQQNAASPTTPILPERCVRLLGGGERRSNLTQDCRRPAGQSGQRRGGSMRRWGGGNGGGGDRHSSINKYLLSIMTV